jgi:uncharacterized protein
VSNEPALAAASPAPPPARFELAIARRRDGVHAEPSALGKALLAAVDSVFADGNYFTDLDYPLLIKALYDHGPELPRGPDGNPVLRFASDIVPFDPLRRKRYGPVKISDGKADYYFEPPLPEGEEEGAPLQFDEFVADMWSKGIRFGIEVEAVRAALESGQAGLVTIARRLDPVAGEDARVLEVSEDLHRSDAPRQLANGKLDLMSFQNRFPQIGKGVRLLKKLPRTAGTPGFELSGIAIEPDIPADFDLASYSGLGTAVERSAEGEFLVSQQAGFLCIDSRTSQLSVGDKIVSHDGVSARTTGNLQLAGDYEEFGEVQEKRVIEGASITVHADVFGNLVSRGGTIILNRNLVGGSAHNRCGDIRVRGIASGAVVQASAGDVVLARAENCIVSGARVTVEQAVNCEIIGDEVTIGHAEGCAVAARRVSIDSAGPRRQSEMVVYALQPDRGQAEQVIAQLRVRIGQFAELAARHQGAMDELTGRADVRKYMLLATRVRKNEVTLTAEQQPQFQKMAQAVAPALKAIGKVSAELKAAEAEQRAALELLARLERQQDDAADLATVQLRALTGETQVRSLLFQPGDASVHDLPARDIKARLRGATGAMIFSGRGGSFEWSSAAPAQEDEASAVPSSAE